MEDIKNKQTNNEMKLAIFEPHARKAFQGIIERCEAAKMHYEWETGLGSDWLIVYLPRGRNKERVFVSNLEDAELLLSSEFEKYSFIDGYEKAMCNYESGIAEAVVHSIGLELPSSFIVHRLTGLNIPEQKKQLKAGQRIFWSIIDDSERIKISIGYPSKAFLGMAGLFEEDVLTVTIEGLKIKQNSEAYDRLRMLTNSLFFEIKQKRNIGLFVDRRYDIENPVRRGGQGKFSQNIGFPKFEYDKEPSDLFWHAASALKMPLLQYLAYYQIIEYYFAKYSMIEAKKEITNCLKDPLFDIEEDNDITKIVDCVSNKLGREVDESTKLSDTIRECISEKEIEEEISSERLRDYFKKEYKAVSQFRISPENKDKDIRGQLADRVYDIRCRIVHTKSDDKRGRIIPFSREEELLRRFELPLIQEIATKVLISNSKSLRF